jgi:O-phosphoseryl-tRNA(Cys) synthetase
VSCADTTARALRRAYARVGARRRFRYVVIDEGHVMGERARRETMAWLRRWLVRG